MNRPRQKEKRPEVSGAPSIQTTATLENDRSEIIDANTDARKRSETIARCRRQLASAGAQLLELSNGSFLVCAGGFSRHAQELSDVQELLRSAGAGS